MIATPLQRPNRRREALLALGMLVCVAAIAGGAVAVGDDSGREIRLQAPAQRIVSLAPYITELLFAAGAGKQIVGTSAHSDFPPAAKEIPRVGDASGFDLERLLYLNPDLVVAWQSGNPSGLVDRIAELGVPVFISEPRRLVDIAHTIERLGVLAGTVQSAQAASTAFRQRYGELHARYARRRPVSVYYQVWDSPLMTINGTHLISDLIRLCGGVNAFSHLPTLTGIIDREALFAADPQVIVAPDAEALSRWRRWPQLRAVRDNRLLFIPGALLARHSPRILDGAERLCAALELARDAGRGDGRIGRDN